jgi:hypothetical protein
VLSFDRLLKAEKLAAAARLGCYLAPLLAVFVCAVCTPNAGAHVTKIVIDSRAVAFANRSFGSVGPYEMLRGRAFGEVDPKDRHNTIIQDIDLAPRNERGMVEYIATFTLLKPVDASKGNGVLFYEVPNRGHSLHRFLNGERSLGADPGDGFLYSHGYSVLSSAWQGDLTPVPTAAESAASLPLETIAVPIAKNLDGSSIAGPYLIRIPTSASDGPSGQIAKLDEGHPLSYEPATLDTSKASLSEALAETIRGTPVGPRRQIASGDWIWADCRTFQAADSTTPSPNLCIKLLKGAFDPKHVYTLVFTARDPLVLGLGLAATRDVVSFFRYAQRDESDNANPIYGTVPHVIGQGVSQTGNFVKTFIHLGFNEDEKGRIVWDGANAHIGGRFAPVNFRFAVPGGSPTLYAPGSEATLWWGPAEDVACRKGTTSMLDRCHASRTCPKIFETFGSAEFWNQRISTGLVGTDAKHDIPLPADVRRYYFPGTTHGGGEGGFHAASLPASKENPSPCRLPLNPNPEMDQMRALIIALTAWVVEGTAPPDSRYPTLNAGLLAADEMGSLKFPSIPGVPKPYGLVNPVLDYDFGPHFNTADLSGYIDREPPIIRQVIPMRVPVVDADGNEKSGVPSVQHAAPLGTYLGWNVVRAGVFAGHICSLNGSFIPFAKTRAERVRSNDPRLSIEERYGDRQGYVCAVRSAAGQLLKERFLLQEDAQRLIGEATEATSSGDLSFLSAAATQKGRSLCAAADASQRASLSTDSSTTSNRKDQKPERTR